MLLESELLRMREGSATAEGMLSGALALPLTLRSDLAQLHGHGNQFLAKLDCLVLGDLTEGRDEARAKRKAMVAACEALIERTEKQIKEIDARKAAGPPAPAPNELDLLIESTTGSATSARGVSVEVAGAKQ